MCFFVAKSFLPDFSVYSLALWQNFALCARVAREWFVASLLCAIATLQAAADPARYASHPPMRPLPCPSNRPKAPGPAFFAHPITGDDRSEGSQEKPWKTIQHAVTRLKPGDTLYLRGGAYYEHVTITASGTSDKPITIRSYPGELAVIDGGLREFFEQPESAWEICPGGSVGEYRSTKTYPDLGGSEAATNVLGNFGDSMVPLHGYRTLSDLRDTSMFWDIKEKMNAEQSVYCGPGIFYDVKTGRIHARLAPTTLEGLHEDNYRGEADPRKIPLVLAGLKGGPVLTLQAPRFLQFQDLVVRGSRTPTIEIHEGFHLLFDGLTVYGGYAAFSVRDTAALRLFHTACRGIAAPWTFRGSLKYRAVEARIFSVSGWEPTGIDSRDFEIAYSEFTDCVDGVFIGNVKGVKFHHNLLDNISDDGLFLTATTAYDGVTPGGDIHIYQNLLSRCLTTFAFGVGHGRQKAAFPSGRQTGAGLHIYRNVFDFRRPVLYYQPGKPEDPQELTSRARFASDHGSPAWEPMNIYHNTIVAGDPGSEYAAIGLGDHLGGGAPRKVFNTIIVQTESVPGQTLPRLFPAEDSVALGEAEKVQEPDPVDEMVEEAPGKGRTKGGSKGSARPGDTATSGTGETGEEGKKESSPAPPSRAAPQVDFQADGNLHWSSRDREGIRDFLVLFRRSKEFEETKKNYPPGWTAHDLYADPRFVVFSSDWRERVDLRLGPGSPAIDAGVPLPPEWPDPLRSADTGDPDIGALPSAAAPSPVGVRGRLTIFGTQSENHDPSEVGPLDPASHPSPFPSWNAKELDQGGEPSARNKPAAILQASLPSDATLLHFVLRRRRVPANLRAGEWLETRDYSRYAIVAIFGSFVESPNEKKKYRPQDLERVKKFMEEGGTLLLSRGALDLFASPEGEEFLFDLVGTAAPETRLDLEILLPEHPWIKQLDPNLARRMVKAPADLTAPLAETDLADPPQEITHVIPQAYLDPNIVVPLYAARGHRLIGSRRGATALYRQDVGKGRFIYLGWQIYDFLSPGRSPSTVEQEKLFEQQVQILFHMADEVYKTGQ